MGQCATREGQEDKIPAGDVLVDEELAGQLASYGVSFQNPMVEEEEAGRLKSLTGAKREKVHTAALHLIDAVDGERHVHPRDDKAHRTAYLWHLRVISVMPFWSTLLLLLHVFETPLWCHRWMANPKLAERIAEPCEDPRYPSYPIMYLSPYWNLVGELALFIPIVGHNLLKWYACGQPFWGRKLNSYAACVCVLYAMDMIYAYNTPQTFFRLAPYLRIGFVILYSAHTRHRLHLVLRTLPEVLSICIVIFGALLFTSWIGVLVFPNESEQGKAEGEGELYFRNLGVGMWYLYILTTTANFPDVMMPAYNNSRWAALFFVTFTAVSCFFLVNVLTAVVFNEFGEQRRERTKQKKEDYRKSFEQAFNILSTYEGREKVVSKESLFAVFHELNHYDEIAYIEYDEAEDAFQSIDDDHSDYISWEEFRTLGQKLVKSISKEKENPTPLIEVLFPRLKKDDRWKQFGNFLLGWKFEVFVDIVLVLNAVLLVMETRGDIIGDSTQESFGKGHQAGDFWRIEKAITLFYGVEVGLKILVAGWVSYSKKPKNQFDFIVTICTTFTAIHITTPDRFVNFPLVRYISLLRLLRILRLLNRLGPFRMVAGTFVAMIPNAVRIFKVLGVVMYFFAALGQNVFGGVINQDPESVYGQRLADTDFAGADYWANNFNDLPSGAVVLFELLVVNNWFVLADGFAIALDTKWVYVYFVGFHVIGVLCCLNIVVAFIIDAFLSEYEKRDTEAEPSRVKSMRKDLTTKVRDLVPEDMKSVSSQSCEELVQALEAKDFGDDPKVDDLVKALKDAMPHAFEHEIRQHPGFDRGLAIVGSLAEVLIRDALADEDLEDKEELIND